ncbi:MAG: putative Ig domain-containing protein [bacterium JZ-2024 1]
MFQFNTFMRFVGTLGLVVMAIAITSCGGGGGGAPPPPLEWITPSNLGEFNAGATVQIQIQVTGGRPPYTWSLLGGFPSDILSFCSGNTSQTCTITGIPGKHGQWTFAVKVTDSGGDSVQRNFTITIKPIGGSLSATKSGEEIVPFDSSEQKASFSLNLSAVGGMGPFSWTVTSGALPQGLSLCGGQPTNRTQRDCPISGTVSDFLTLDDLLSPSGRNITLQVTDSNNPPLSASVSLTLKAYYQLAPGIHNVGKYTILTDWYFSVQPPKYLSHMMCWGFLGTAQNPTGVYVYGIGPYTTGDEKVYISIPYWPIQPGDFSNIRGDYIRPPYPSDSPTSGNVLGDLSIVQFVPEKNKLSFAYYGKFSSPGGTVHLYTRRPLFEETDESRLNGFPDSITVDYDSTLCPPRVSVP